MAKCGREHPRYPGVTCINEAGPNGYCTEGMHFAHGSPTWLNNERVDEILTPKPDVIAQGRTLNRQIRRESKEIDRRRQPDENVVPVGMHHPETSKRAAKRSFPHSGTWRLKVLMEILSSEGHERDGVPPGRCDHELERIFDRAHESISATRNSLMKDGWIVDSGVRRPHPVTGNEAIVWRATQDAWGWFQAQAAQGSLRA